MGKMRIRIGIKRIVIVLLWITGILGALYLPHLKPFEQNELNIFTWGDILDPQLVVEFEKKTGIKVRLSYYSTNEELLVKLKATRTLGYDLIVPSDYAVSLLAKEKLLKPINKQKFQYWSQLDPLLLGHPFDPNNEYSIPFSWEIFGLGVDKEYFAEHRFTPSWKLIFDPSWVQYKISMINDPIEAIPMASLYLFGRVETLSEQEFSQISRLLIEQQNWIVAYADFRADYFLATKNCPVVVASSAYIWRSQKNFPFIDFILPKEGTFITIENFCIPEKTDKEDQIYQFLNFIYRPESIAKHYQAYGYFPAEIVPDELLKMDEDSKRLMKTAQKQFNRLHFFNPIISSKEMRDLWVEVKSFGG